MPTLFQSPIFPYFLIFSEVPQPIVHDGAHVVPPHHVDPAQLYLPEVMLVALFDILPLDGDVLVSVWPTLFMPESYSMHQLVQDSMQMELLR